MSQEVLFLHTGTRPHCLESPGLVEHGVTATILQYQGYFCLVSGGAVPTHRMVHVTGWREAGTISPRIQLGERQRQLRTGGMEVGVTSLVSGGESQAPLILV